MRYTDKDYWDRYWELENRGGAYFYFSNLLDLFIPWEKMKSYMEIGGAPGSIMAYMHNEHNLSVATVDFTKKERMEKYLRSLGVNNAVIINEDFGTMSVSKYKHSFDIVASWGFVEHFDRAVASKFIEKKKKMVAEDGYLIIELPNIRKLFWLSYWLFNRELIKIQNLKIRELKWLCRQVNICERF